MNKDWWEYENLESGWPYDWNGPAQINEDDKLDFHLDIGGGRLPKGRLNIDINPEADIQMDLNTMELINSKGPLTQEGNRLPFPDESIESIISHHCLEHIGTGFVSLMDECHRVLKKGAIFRIIVPLYPCLASISDPDHKRYFTKETFMSFVHNASLDTPFWTESFSKPYTQCRFLQTNLEYSPPPTIKQLAEQSNKNIGGLTIDDLIESGRELRTTLEKQ